MQTTSEEMHFAILLRRRTPTVRFAAKFARTNPLRSDRWLELLVLRVIGCINLARLLVALTRVGRFHLTHQTHLAFAARICSGGIGLSAEILSRGSFSDFILAC